MKSERRRGRWRGRDRGFTAEITFSGLGLLNILKADPWDPNKSRGPRRVETLEMLFPKTEGTNGECGDGYHCEPHFPRLTYYTEDHLGLIPLSEQRPEDEEQRYEYLPSPEGREAVSVDLTDRHVKIIPPWHYKEARSELLWCPPGADGTFPNTPNPGQEHYLDWLLRGGQIGFSGVRDKENNAVTTIELPHGEWRGRGVYVNREVPQVPRPRSIGWFVGRDQWSRGENEWSDRTDEKSIQAMGPDLVLVLRDLMYGLTVRISKRVDDRRLSDPHDIVLTPGPDRRLRFSLSNLPRTYSEADVSHVSMYCSLSGQKPQDLTPPEQADDVVCAQSACNQLITFEDAERKRVKGKPPDELLRTKTARKGGGT